MYNFYVVEWVCSLPYLIVCSLFSLLQTESTRHPCTCFLMYMCVQGRHLGVENISLCFVNIFNLTRTTSSSSGYIYFHLDYCVVCIPSHSLKFVFFRHLFANLNSMNYLIVLIWVLLLTVKFGCLLTCWLVLCVSLPVNGCFLGGDFSWKFFVDVHYDGQYFLDCLVFSLLW